MNSKTKKKRKLANKHQRDSHIAKLRNTQQTRAFMKNKCIAWCLGTKMVMFNEDLKQMMPPKHIAINLNICKLPWNIYTLVILKDEVHGYSYLIDQIKTNKDFLYEEIGTKASKVHTKRLNAANQKLVSCVGWIARVDGGELDNDVCEKIMVDLGHKKYLASWEDVPNIDQEIANLIYLQENA